MGRADKPDHGLGDDAGDFLARWSQRKLEAKRQAAEPGDAGNDISHDAAEPDSAVETSAPANELTDADMPSLESLAADSDYTPFLSPGVSDGLRRLALRKLFSQPSFNVTDGLNDYDEDYTQFAKLGNVITHEMKRMLQRAREDREQDAQQVVEPQHADADLPEEELQAGEDAGDINTIDAAEDNNDPDDSNAVAEDKT